MGHWDVLAPLFKELPHFIEKYTLKKKNIYIFLGACISLSRTFSWKSFVGLTTPFLGNWRGENWPSPSSNSHELVYGGSAAEPGQKPTSLTRESPEPGKTCLFW